MSGANGPPGERVSRAQQSQETRARLLVAARQVFREAGYAGARLDRIADAAGYTKGALYWHFPNKETLFFALVAEAVDDNRRWLGELIALGERDPEELDRALAAWIDRIDEEAILPLFGVELEIEARHNPSFLALHHELLSRHEAALADFFVRYFALVGRTSPLPPDLLAGTVLAMFKGFALTRLNHPGTPPSSAPLVRLLLGLPRSA